VIELHNKSLCVGDCLITYGKGIDSYGSRWFTSFKVSHTAIYVGGGDSYVIEAVPDGVIKTRFSDFIKDKTFLCVRRIPNLTVENAEKMKSAAYDFLNTPYNFFQRISLSLYSTFRKFGLYFPLFVRNRPSPVISSELWYDCAKAAGFRIRTVNGAVTPEVLLTTSKLATVFQKREIYE